MKSERELFLEWHYNQYLSENPNIDLSNAKYIYNYAHTHAMVGSIRENLFIAWQASTQREGFRLVPVDTLDECLSWASVARWDSPSEERDIEIDYHVGIIEAAIGAVDDDDYKRLYKLMIE